MNLCPGRDDYPSCPIPVVRICDEVSPHHTHKKIQCTFLEQGPLQLQQNECVQNKMTQVCINIKQLPISKVHNKKTTPEFCRMWWVFKTGVFHRVALKESVRIFPELRHMNQHMLGKSKTHVCKTHIPQMVVKHGD